MLVNYFDMGLHVDGTELGWMVNYVLPELGVPWVAYGFEASARYFASVRSRLGSKKGVTLVNVAIGGFEGVGKLFEASSDGGDSLYGSKRNALPAYQVVPVTRFSTWLRSNSLTLTGNLNVLRLNIEGAELEVFNDLDREGMLAEFGVLAGSAQCDLAKVEELKDKRGAYDALLASYGKVVVPYCAGQINNVDMLMLLREKLAEYSAGV